jgi:hypothetical protein
LRDRRGPTRARPQVSRGRGIALTEPLPIPDDIWRRLREFLEAGKTGQVTLHVSEGHVLTAELTERVRVPRRPC